MAIAFTAWRCTGPAGCSHVELHKFNLHSGSAGTYSVSVSNASGTMASNGAVADGHRRHADHFGADQLHEPPVMRLAWAPAIAGLGNR